MNRVYLTLKQCAELAHIGVSSARFYKDKPEFKHYFTTIGEGRNTKYQEESTVELLTLIGKSYADNLDADQIVDLLENRYGVITDLVVQEENNNTTITQQEDLTNSIRLILREELQQELNKRDSAILHLQQELTSIKESLATHHQRAESGYRESQDRDAEIMSMMRDMQDDKERMQQRKWWHIFFKK